MKEAIHINMDSCGKKVVRYRDIIPVRQIIVQDVDEFQRFTVIIIVKKNMTLVVLVTTGTDMFVLLAANYKL